MTIEDDVSKLKEAVAQLAMLEGIVFEVALARLATLRAWKEDGRITYLGVTHYTSSAYDQLEAVMRQEPLDFVQLNYAMNDRAAERTLLPLAKTVLVGRGSV
jgi:aryl-alcohol dehydrogenase-like predicted oxidoreductase